MDIQYIVIELKKKGLTQPEIASAIGCSQPTVSDIENGKIGKSRPSWKIVSGLQSLAQEHGVATSPQLSESPTDEDRRAAERRAEEDRRQDDRRKKDRRTAEQGGT